MIKNAVREQPLIDMELSKVIGAKMFITGRKKSYHIQFSIYIEKAAEVGQYA